jgi:pteridine reductase
VTEAAGPRVALVTGAGHRVGRALAVALGGDGFRVAVHFHASGDAARETVEAIRAVGSDAIPFAADLAGPDAPGRLVREVVASFGRLDVVVNSAAVMERTPLGEVTAEHWDAILHLNLRAPFLIAQEAARHLPDGGSIVNIADLSAFETWPAYVPHGVSKSGVLYLTRALARVLAPRIRVNAVAPGTVLPPKSMDAGTATRFAATTPLGRNGSVEDVVEAVRYLLGAGYVTGQTIVVDGGRRVRQ